MKIYFSTSLSTLSIKTQTDNMRFLRSLQRNGSLIFPHDIVYKIEHWDKYIDANFKDEQRSKVVQRSLSVLKRKADVVVFLVNGKSIALGQEIAQSLAFQKPTILLYPEGNEVPHILQDSGREYLIMSPYTNYNLEQVLAQSIDYATSIQEVRFNFQLSAQQNRYLIWLAERYKATKSSILRAFIQSNMDNNREFHKLEKLLTDS